MQCILVVNPLIPKKWCKFLAYIQTFITWLDLIGIIVGGKVMC